MILYRLAKWMEERKRLKRLIAESDGNSGLYIQQKADVERQMMREAYQWLEPGKLAAEPAFVLSSPDELGVEPVPGLTESDRLSVADVLADMRRSALAAEVRGRLAARADAPIAVEDLVPEELLHMPLVGEQSVQAQP